MVLARQMRCKAGILPPHLAPSPLIFFSQTNYNIYLGSFSGLFFN
jgi:hypothetical protein